MPAKGPAGDEPGNPVRRSGRHGPRAGAAPRARPQPGQKRAPAANAVPQELQ